MPLWFYGDLAKGISVDNNLMVAQSSCQTTDACGLPKVAENSAPFESKDVESQSIFPINSAMASGLFPIRKKNVPDIKIWAGSSVVIDVDTGTIIHYDDGRKRTQIASLTKMMTAILVMENIKDLNEQITITKEDLRVDGTKVGCPTSVICNSNRMYVGEKVYAKDLMKAMLMNSANDSATALGTHIAGSSQKFVDMMNYKAEDMGLKDTHFCTPSGLEIDGQEDQCYSTAYDLARIAAYSLKFDTIWDIMKIPEGQFYSCDGKYMHVLKNTDMLLNTLPGCVGGKTGFTPLAGKSLMLGAEEPTGKHKIIAVLLNDEQRWDDMRTLVNWVFENYKWQ
ncbi:MAG: D-alanyl-D-alanine carboxypeptidase DacB [Candidatus Moranbacteria bacterium GW2011_GWA2_39_41]|nr:MAG: D-alanyl-D-alanine carboxypeptidase DacB [Candidatus Moranbacteria bacterium GW2011_GWA2_39_41]